VKVDEEDEARGVVSMVIFLDTAPSVEVINGDILASSCGDRPLSISYFLIIFSRTYLSRTTTWILISPFPFALLPDWATVFLPFFGLLARLPDATSWPDAEAELADLGFDGILGGGIASEADEAVLARLVEGGLMPVVVDVGLRDIVWMMYSNE
jgi:hypothetical protein